MRWSQIRNSCQKSFIAAGRKNNNAQSYVRLHLVPMINVGTWKTSTCFSLGGDRKEVPARIIRTEIVFIYSRGKTCSYFPNHNFLSKHRKTSFLLYSQLNFQSRNNPIFFSVDRMCAGCLRETKVPLVDVINCSPVPPPVPPHRASRIAVDLTCCICRRRPNYGLRWLCQPAPGPSGHLALAGAVAWGVT